MRREEIMRIRQCHLYFEYNSTKVIFKQMRNWEVISQIVAKSRPEIKRPKPEDKTVTSCTHTFWPLINTAFKLAAYIYYITSTAWFCFDWRVRWGSVRYGLACSERNSGIWDAVKHVSEAWNKHKSQIWRTWRTSLPNIMQHNLHRLDKLWLWTFSWYLPLRTFR